MFNEKSLQQNDPGDSARSPSDSRRTFHAIRRWRSYLPHRPFTPEPDPSWTDECPCGTPLPCPHHGSLWREVRYVKPSDPDYAAALTRVGIRVYTPSATDLDPLPKPLSEPCVNLSIRPSQEAPNLNAR